MQTSTDDKKRTDQANPPPKHLFIKNALTGFGLNFQKCKFYYKTQNFEFINNIKITRLSPSGKTCAIEIVYHPKRFSSTFYFPLKEVETKAIERVWMKTLIRGLWED